MQLLNTYKCVGNPTVQSFITTDQWFNEIKCSEYSETITYARNFNKGDKEYEEIKAKLPCVTYNFLYQKYKKDSNIIVSTDLLFLDIDSSEFDVKSIDVKKIYSYYKSFGGKGYTIIVKVKGVNKDNFKATYHSIVDELYLTDYIDYTAVKHSQFTILSFDPYLYINEQPYIFNSISSSNSNYPQPLCNNQKKRKHIGSVGEKNVIYNNIFSFDFEGYDFITNWDEGFDFIHCYQPFYKLTDKRKRTLLSYLTNLVWLNPNLDYFHYVNLMNAVNTRICENPLPSNFIIGIVAAVLKQKNEKKLSPIFKKRRILFAPHNELSRGEKMKKVANIIKDKFRIEGCYRINDCIENWDFERLGKITAMGISKVTGMNKKTVEKYYFEFKEFVRSLNEKFKNAKMGKNN